MSLRAHRMFAVFVLLVMVLTGCASDQTNATRGQVWQDRFDLESRTHLTTGKNRFFILEPGYQIVLASKREQVAITVLDETEKVNGIETRVVEEREFEDGKLKEVSRNYFTICKENGDVFYHGEDVDDYEDGKIVAHSGAWRAGVNGARAGLIMPAATPVGLRHYQEIAPKAAMDRAEIVADDVTLEAPTEKFRACLKVVETSPLEPGEESVKLYAPGVGMVFDDGLVIVDRGRNRKPPTEPIAVTVDVSGAYAEVEIAEKDMPAPVAAVVRKLYPEGRIHEVRRETRSDGKTVYAIEVFIGAQQYDVEATPEGKVLRNEKD